MKTLTTARSRLRLRLVIHTQSILGSKSALVLKTVGVLLVLLGLGCGSDTGTDEDLNNRLPDMGIDQDMAEGSRLESEFEALTMTVGATIGVDIAVDGQTVDPGLVTWSSDNPQVLAIQDGLWASNGVGSAEVVAEYMDASKSFAVTVIEPKYKQVDAGIETLCVLSQTGKTACQGMMRRTELDLSPYAFSKIAVSRYGGCGIESDGEVICWGTDGPAGPEAFDEKVTDIDMGPDHLCAILESGSIECSGQGGWWQLGSVIPGVEYTRGQVAGEFTSVHSAGAQNCAVRATGGRTCWGRNRKGLLTNSDESRLLPVFVEDGRSGQLFMGDENACSLDAQDSLFCWGSGDTGAADVADTLPTQAVHKLDHVKTASLGWGTICAITKRGRMHCWGQFNGFNIPVEFDGQDLREPVQVEGYWTDVTMGGYFGCATNIGGELLCWGADQGGALSGRMGRSPIPRTASWLDGAEAIAISGNATCFLKNAELQCAGLTGHGQAGIGDAPQAGPAAVITAPETVVDFDLNYFGGCAATESGRLLAWGSNHLGQITPSMFSVTVYSEPQDINLQGRVVEVGCEESNSCALLDTGELYCWGLNSVGQTSPLSTQELLGITKVDFSDAGTPARFVSLRTRPYSTCALSTKDNLYCWGENLYGESAGRRFYPVPFNDVAKFEVGHSTTCVLYNSGDLYCYGQFGRGIVERPQLIASEVKDVGVGTAAVCILNSQDKVECMGLLRGVLATFESSTEFIELENMPSGKSIRGFDNTFCVFTQDDKTMCWGKDELGAFSQEEWTHPKPTLVEFDALSE